MLYKKTVYPKPYETESRRTCDRCGETISPDWRYHDRSEVTLESKTGSVYPEGDFRTVTTADCCVDCWTSSVRPALESLGFKLRERDAECPSWRDVPVDPEWKDERR